MKVKFSFDDFYKQLSEDEKQICDLCKDWNLLDNCEQCELCKEK